MSTDTGARTIVIIGGGIIGCTTAYYITHHPSFDAARDSVTIVESATVAGGASGKAGGLIATWARPRALAQLSCAEHKRLADLHGGAERWGYRRVSCGQWNGSLLQKDSEDTGRLPKDLGWLSEDLTESYTPIADDGGDTAQVHPYQFTTSMLAFAQERGAKLILGKAVSLTSDGDRVSGVQVATGSSQTHLPASAVIVAAGPWAKELVPSLPLAFSLGHSIVVHPSAPVSAHCVFTSIEGYAASPEIFPRPNGEVYLVHGADTSGVLAPSTADVPLSEEKCDALQEVAARISPALAGAKITARQACYRPELSRGAGPIIGEMTRDGEKGLFVAVGHSCWGICNAPGTARTISELVMDGHATCVDIAAVSPGRFL